MFRKEARFCFFAGVIKISNMIGSGTELYSAKNWLYSMIVFGMLTASLVNKGLYASEMTPTLALNSKLLKNFLHYYVRQIPNVLASFGLTKLRAVNRNNFNSKCRRLPQILT